MTKNVLVVAQILSVMSPEKIKANYHFENTFMKELVVRKKKHITDRLRDLNVRRNKLSNIKISL